MPLIDGEKWACQSCIKGHRVSGCTHHERELHHINPKGRPVKQCEHCRGARKSKSHHAKCDCGEKKDKDKHKDKGDAKVTEGQCCCHSGGACICGIKNDADLKPDTGKQTLHNARAKPKLTSTQSESVLTKFSNGHHKPCHRNNNTAHVSGAPYKARPHTLHGQDQFAAAGMAPSNAYTQRKAQDTLSMSNTDWYSIYGPRTVEGTSTTPVTGSLDSSNIQDSLFARQGSGYSPDGTSPGENLLNDTVSAQPWQWASSVTPVNPIFGIGSLSTSPSQDCLPNLENEWSLSSAGFSHPSIFSSVDLPLHDRVSQPISHSGESKFSAPGLTTTSSPHSEVGEPGFLNELDFKPPPSTVSESLFWEDTATFRSATSAPNDNFLAPTSAPASSTPDSQIAEFRLGKDLNAVGDAVGTVSPNDYNEAAIAMPNNLDDVPNNLWLMDQTPGGFEMYAPQTTSNWL